MRLRIYQSFFDPKQYRSLDKAFIPFSNIKNSQPELREYPLLKKLHEKNANFIGHWGMVSWKWKDKTKISGKDFISWIQSNPGYDVYIMNPYPRLPEMYNNTIVQSIKDHEGIIEYYDRLLDHLGYGTIKITDLEFPLNIFSTCHFYVGNSKFWDNWMSFIEMTLDISDKDEMMQDFLYNKKSIHNDIPLINFSFAIERLVSLFLYLNYKEYKIIHYPYQYLLKKTSKELELTSIHEKALQLRENAIY